MIRLTINAHTGPEIHLFNKSTILIGGESSQVDLLIPNLDLQPVHLKITEQSDLRFLINLTNDPFITVNGRPFGKTVLNSGDVLQIQDIEILYEILRPLSEELPPSQSLELSESPVPEEELLREGFSGNLKSEKKQSDHPALLNIELPFDVEIAPLREDELQQDHLEHYLHNEIIRQSYTGEKGSSTEAESIPEKARKNIGNLKDDYLRDLDDENQIKGETDEPSHLYQAWKWILLFIFSLFIVAGIIGTVIYFTVSDKTEAQETKAAQAVADIAMALAHAQLYELSPHNRNWSDIDFLKENLQTILPDTPSYASELDSHGRFNLFPYSLRIYTNSTLSNFLLIAQPAPSFLQWLIPKSVILVDSHSMELRTTKDVRGLNRLLANPNPLDGVNSKEIFALVKQSHLIHLGSLANKNNPLDFTPPKNLASVESGAENFIYNAPRYYHFGKALIQKATLLTTLKTTSQEVTSFKRDVENFSRLNHLILYSDQGKAAALRTKQGLRTFAPGDKITFGYLAVNSEGKIQNVDLLREEDEKEQYLMTRDNPTEIASSIGDRDPDRMHTDGEIASEETHSSKIPDFDINHPIYVQLVALMKAREVELKALALSMKEMLEASNSQFDPRFKHKFLDTVDHYLLAEGEHKKNINEAIAHLYKQYEEVPTAQFIQFVTESGCGEFIREREFLKDRNP